MPSQLSVPERFFSKIKFTESCWIWSAGCNADGYGRFNADPKKNHVVRAHRWSYEFFVGPIPEGLTIDHVKEWGCTSRACVNPDHLEPVSALINKLRGIQRGTHKSHCPAGHEYNERNTRIRWDGLAGSGYSQVCRPCQSASHARYKLRRINADAD